MYYNKIYRIWMIDSTDIFLLSIMVGSFAASYLKDSLSEKKSMKRLR